MLRKSAEDVIRLEAECINGLIDHIDNSFDEAINIIMKCRGRVVVTGMGKSGLIGKKISATLASTGTPSFFMHPAEAIHGDLGMLKKEDVLLALSNSGETSEIVKMIPFAQKKQIKIISITGNRHSYLAKNSDCFLNSWVKKEAGQIGLPPTCSTTAQLVLGDALSIVLSECKKFEASDFKALHPGGALGKKLAGHVKDVMVRGYSIPMVNENATLTEAIKEISEKRFGFTVIVNNSKKVSGILTDGDLRRIILRHKNKDFYSLSLKEIMTRHPLTITKDIFIADALELMEKKQITSLIVTDEEDNIEGVVHLHDLLGRGNIEISI